MKKLFLIIGLLIFLPLTQAYEHYSQQEERRDLFYFWQNEELKIQGFHQPYAKMKLFQEKNLLSSVNTDEKGYFIFSVNSLSPKQSHELKIEVYNYFNEKIDAGNLTINPGTQTKGQVLAKKIPIKNALLKLIDKDERILEKTYTDQSGYFSFNSVPKSAKIIISGEGIEKKEIEVQGDEFLIIDLELDENSPPTIKQEEETTPIETESSTQKNNTIFYGLIVSFFVILIGIFIKGYLLKKK